MTWLLPTLDELRLFCSDNNDSSSLAENETHIFIVVETNVRNAPVTRYAVEACAQSKPLSKQIYICVGVCVYIYIHIYTY